MEAIMPNKQIIINKTEMFKNISQVVKSLIHMSLFQQMKEPETHRFHQDLKMSETVSLLFINNYYSVACYFGSLI